MPLARILRLPHPDPKRRSTRGPTRWSPRACTRGSGPSRPTATGSASAGTAPPTPRASSTAPNRRGTTATCASSPATSAPRCSSRTSGRRSAAPCSRPTATPSAMTAGCSCTTATSTSSPRSSATSSSPSTRRCIREIQGQADTEVLFYLALTFGLEDDPPAAVEQAIGLVEAVAERHGVPHPFQGTIATTDGESIWAFRYSSERNSRSLFYTTDVPTLRKLYPERQLFHGVLGRRAADRLRTPRRRRRRLERGTRIHLRHRRPRPRRDAAIQPEAPPVSVAVG